MTYRLALILLLLPGPLGAQISLDGSAAMGLDLDGSGNLHPRQETRLEAQASVITDGGVEFGAILRMRSRDRRDCALGFTRPAECGGPGGTRMDGAALFMQIGGE